MSDSGSPRQNDVDRPPTAGPPVSRSGAIKIVATVIGIGGAIALLLTASISKGAEYYKHVDEVMANVDGCIFASHGSKLTMYKRTPPSPSPIVGLTMGSGAGANSPLRLPSHGASFGTV